MFSNKSLMLVLLAATIVSSFKLFDEDLKAVEEILLTSQVLRALGFNESMTNIEIVNKTVRIIDKNALIGFPNLERFYFSDPKLFEVRTRAFDQTPSLKTLIITKCYLNTIVESMFLGLDALQELDLTKNNISTLGTNVFAPFQSLRKLTLAQNLIEKIDEKTFEGLLNLRELDLSNNAIKVIRAKTFFGFSLDSLRMNSNQVGRVFDNGFANFCAKNITFLGNPIDDNLHYIFNGTCKFIEVNLNLVNHSYTVPSLFDFYMTHEIEPKNLLLE